MSVRKECDKCGQKISVRKMPNGRWVPFDYNTNTQHKCSSATYKKPVQKKVPIAKAPSAPKPAEIVKPIYINQNSNTTILPHIRSAIDNNYNVIINYCTTSRNAWSTREITPYKIYANENGTYIEAFCHMRNEKRTFRVDKIRSVEIVHRIKMNETAAIIDETENNNPSVQSFDFNKLVEILFYIVLILVFLKLLIK